MSCGILNAWDTITLCFMTLYFLHWSKDWFPICFFMSVIGALAHVFMMVAAPENPRWLLSQGRREEAIAAFNRIAKFNRSKFSIPENATFGQPNQG